MEQLSEDKLVVKEKNSLFFYFLLFFIFTVGIATVLISYRFLISKPASQKTVISEKNPQVTKPSYLYKSQPPSQALVGKLDKISGLVEKQSRDSNDWVEISTFSAVLQGESLKLNSIGRATALFENQTTLRLGKNTETSFINLIPEKFMLEQKNGIASFENLKPISLKVFDSLTVLEAGEFSVDVNGEIGRFNLSISSGSAKLSFVDNSNDTQVYTLTKGENARYDSATNTVIIK